MPDFETKVLDGLHAIAGAATAFVDHVVKSDFLQRVDRADKATELIFNYMFDRKQEKWSDLSGLTFE